MRALYVNISWLRLAVAHRMLQSALYISMTYARPTGLLVAGQAAAVGFSSAGATVGLPVA